MGSGYAVPVYLSDHPEKDGEILDEAEDTFGIRSIQADAQNGFRLNGRPLNLKGGCLHHDNGFLGACAYPKAERRKLEISSSKVALAAGGRPSS